MYDRTLRFKKLHTRTPARVGPASYLLSEIFDKNGYGNQTPFNSTSIRTSPFENKNSALTPSPNKYKICFRKTRIVGGTSLQNQAPRVKNKIPQSYGLYTSVVPKYLKGKLHTGTPPRNESTKVSSIPEKGALGYDITSRGLVKIYHPPENRAIGPAAYYNPKGHHNYTTLQYKGNFWSLRTAHRFRYKDTEGPGPAEYVVGQPSTTAWQEYQQQLQQTIKSRAPLLRSSDILQRKLCRENFPGPSDYSPSDPNTRKCDRGKEGTFSKANRSDLMKTAEGPGPADYNDPRTAISKVKTAPAFVQSSKRFQNLRKLALPGPGEYSPQEGIWANVQKKAHSKYSRWNAPFDSSAVRNMSLIKPGGCFVPGPGSYYPQFQKKCRQTKKSYMFVPPQSETKKVQVSPGPAAYSALEPFKATSDPKSHLHNTTSAFLSSSNRLGAFGLSESPAPNIYTLPDSTLSKKGCIIGSDYIKSASHITPGPPDYKVHPKYARSSLFNTFNVTLQPPQKSRSKEEKKHPIKKLRCFSPKRYLTGHCSSS